MTAKKLFETKNDVFLFIFVIIQLFFHKSFINLFITVTIFSTQKHWQAWTYNHLMSIIKWYSRLGIFEYIEYQYVSDYACRQQTVIIS